MADIKPGDEVRVLNSRRRAVVPEGGHWGTVIKVARKYATAVFDEPWTDPVGKQGSREHEITFDMETGYERAGYAGWYVRTPEQLDREERRKTALFLLAEHGIKAKLGYENSITLEQLEALAEVAKTWDRED